LFLLDNSVPLQCIALTTIRFVETYILQQIGWLPSGFKWTVLDSVGHPTPEIPAYTGKNSEFLRKINQPYEPNIRDQDARNYALLIPLCRP